MNYRLMIAVSLVAVLLLAACGGGASTGGGGASGPGPADVARSFFTAVFTGEGEIEPLVCSAAAEQVDAMRESLALMAQSGAEVDVSGLTFTEQNVSGDTAEVVVAGNIKMSVAGAEQEVPFPETPIPMRNENGWKVCA